MTDPCKMRRPNTFLITVMTSDRAVIETVQRDYQPGFQDRIDVPLNMIVDICSLVVTIRAGNSAGMSLPTEIEFGRSLHILPDL